MRAAEVRGRPGGLPAAIIVGGDANALSVARSLGRRGIRVFALNEPRAAVRYSRHCTWLEAAGSGAAEWLRYLLGPAMDRLHGAVLLAASDSAVMMLARHRAALQRRFVLDLSDPDAQLTMLDKLETYRVAREAGVPTPAIWEVDRSTDIAALRQALLFPLLVKPRMSHLFERRFGTKFFVVRDLHELDSALGRAAQAELDVLLMELVPGPDSLLCSYYTYLDQHGEAVFDFTKRVIRRHPVGMGTGCLHVTDEVPLVKEHALRLFRRAGLRGVANAEFKQDPRTGELKLIECNARFTAANCLLASAGIDLAYLVYARAVGLALPPCSSFRSGLRLWNPLVDYFAARELRRRGELTWLGWASDLIHPLRFAYFAWSDPAPGWKTLSFELRRMLRARRSFRLLRAARRPAQDRAPLRADVASLRAVARPSSDGSQPARLFASAPD